MYSLAQYEGLNHLTRHTFTMTLTMTRLLLTLILVTLLSACMNAHRIRIDQGVLIEPETLQSLQVGLTQDQVRKIYGPPANQSSFNSNRWEYLFQSTDPSFQADKVKKLTIEFDTQGYVTRWTTPS